MPPTLPQEQLDGVPVGRAATVLSVECERPTARRLMELGLLPGTRVDVVRVAPMGCPLELRVRDSALSIRREDAARVAVQLVAAP
ncbi:MAG: FeoA family protein [Polyangiales bacterium]|nr:ferrous iron transport protein A [Myxococcales bacterium]